MSCRSGLIEGHHQEMEVHGQTIHQRDFVVKLGTHQFGCQGFAGLIAKGSSQGTLEVHEHTPKMEGNGKTNWNQLTWWCYGMSTSKYWGLCLVQSQRRTRKNCWHYYKRFLRTCQPSFEVVRPWAYPPSWALIPESCHKNICIRLHHQRPHSTGALKEKKWEPG